MVCVCVDPTGYCIVFGLLVSQFVVDNNNVLELSFFLLLGWSVGCKREFALVAAVVAVAVATCCVGNNRL